MCCKVSSPYSIIVCAAGCPHPAVKESAERCPHLAVFLLCFRVSLYDLCASGCPHPEAYFFRRVGTPCGTRLIAPPHLPPSSRWSYALPSPACTSDRCFLLANDATYWCAAGCPHPASLRQPLSAGRGHPTAHSKYDMWLCFFDIAWSS